MANFPVTMDVLSNPTSSTKTNDSGFELDVVISTIQDILEALEQKLGIGSTSATGATALEGTGSVTSAWVKSAFARVTHDADQSIANSTTTTLAFNTEVADNDVIHDNSTNNSRLTCKTAGTYLIIANVRWDANTTGGRAVEIRLGGSTIIAENFSAPTPSSVMSHVVATLYELAVNDYVEVRVTQFSGDALNIKLVSGTSPLFMMKRIGKNT